MPDRQQAIVLALLTLLFHVLTAKGYGYFRDELYYIACSEHLAFGYVDHPPLIALVTWLRPSSEVSSNSKSFSCGEPMR